MENLLNKIIMNENNINVEALILFKQYSHLQLKSFNLSVDLNEDERKQVDTALEYYRMYNTHILSKSNK